MRSIMTGLLIGIIATSLTWAAPADQRARASANVLDRKQLVADVQAEVTFGQRVAARILGRDSLHEDPDLNRYVNLVGKAVAAHSSRTELAYHFAVIDSPDINAYAAPGGYIFVTHGALQAMESEAELAAVLAHEVAHVTKRHIVEALNIRGHSTGAGASLARLLGAASDPSRLAFSQAVDQAMEILFDRGLDQQDELEADRTALLLLANSGYDPQALGRYLQRVANRQAERADVMSDTHPPFDQRLAKVAAASEELALAALNYPRVAARFHQRVNDR